MPSDDDAYAHEVIRTVRQLTERVEAYTRGNDESRARFQASIEGIVVALRSDVHRSITALQLTDSQHKDDHIAERKERAADSVQRSNRQFIWDLWMGGLTALGVINLILAVYLVARGLP